MSRRDETFLLQDVIASMENIDEYTRELTLDNFLSDRRTQDAVVRNFTIMREAVARMTHEFKEEHTQVDWRGLKDFRNTLIPFNEIIDYSVVWQNIKKELPPVYKQTKDLLNKLTNI